MAKHITIGQLGEEEVVRFIENNGHTILDRNFRSRFGELDIVSKKDGVMHFIEVKSVEEKPWMDQLPEENVTQAKREKMAKTIEIYLSEKRLEGVDFTIDIAGVFVNLANKSARVRILEDVTF
mgnify:FL=1